MTPRPETPESKATEKDEATASTTPTASAEATEEPDTPESLKEKGNVAVRAEKYTEAVLHYSFAIKMSPNDAILYSNRSLAFFKLQQLYYANEDAEKAIQLRPDWAKGYFRKAEVHAAAEQYDTSLLSYGRALQLQPSDSSILAAAKRVASLSARQTERDNKLPWMSCSGGLAVGVAIVVADQLFPKSPSLNHPLIMIIVIAIFAGLFYVGAKAARHYMRLQKRGLLEPPVDILDDFRKDTDKDQLADDEASLKNRNRYSKAQARQRFRQGKS